MKDIIGIVFLICSFYFVCRYNNLFRFLLKVKRTQLDLQQVWAAYMGTKHLSTAQLSNMTKIWLARMHMAFLVDNLQYYLQVSDLRDILDCVLVILYFIFVRVLFALLSGVVKDPLIKLNAQQFFHGKIGKHWPCIHRYANIFSREIKPVYF